MTTAAETASFRGAHEAVIARAPGLLPGVRERALEAFEAMGLPTTRDEDWRSTPVGVLGKIPFAPAPPVPSSRAHELFIAGHSGPRIVLVNGRVDVSLSQIDPLPAGVSMERVAASPSSGGSVGGAAPFRVVEATDGAFPALNAALLEDCLVVSVAAGAVVEQPIHVTCVTDGRGEPVIACPRLVVSLGDRAQATVVETHGSWAGETFENAVTEIELGEGAVLKHVLAQLLGPSAFLVSTSRARLGRAACFRSHVVSLGARLSRHDLAVELAGEGASCELHGLTAISGAQHVDHHTFVDHAVPHASSTQVYKGAYSGASRGVFAGAVRVRKDAQKSEAHQTSRNLILSADALVDAKPELEIHADDVKCTHGATIGQLEEEQLFYLLARGIDSVQARQILVRAFLEEQVARIPDDAVRADVAARVAARIAEMDAS